MVLSRFLLIVALVAVSSGSVLLAEGKTPGVGDKAPDFSLQSLGAETVRLSALTKQGPVVLLVLRGFPGYQCPICTRQVRDFMNHASEFSAAGAQVLMVYPGPSDDLQVRAGEFVQGKTLPCNFTLVIDPGYQFTNLYGLRWDAPRETAYPSTFLIGSSGTVFYSLVSHSHGGRAKAADMIAKLAEHQ